MTRLRSGLLALSALLAFGTWATLSTRPPAAQGTASRSLTLAPGRYTLLCDLTDHDVRGTVSTLQVN